jgi:hypothetical protein
LHAYTHAHTHPLRPNLKWARDAVGIPRRRCEAARWCG